MPQTFFDPENKPATPWNYPKIHLKYGDMYRINVIQRDLNFEFVHTVEAPILQGGQPKMVTRERKDKSTYETIDKEFLGRSICAGRPDVLEKKGRDPETCPLCEISEAYDALRLPERRFASHVLEYVTKEGSWDVPQDPFQARLKAWVFNERVYNDVSTQAHEWATQETPAGEVPNYSAILQKHDLLLGPCTNEGFQQFDVRMAGRAEWMLTEQSQQFTAALWNNPENRAEDLTTLLGKHRDITAMKQQAEEVMNRTRQARGIAGPTAVGAPAAAGAQDIDSLLSQVGVPAPQPVAQSQPVAVPDLDAPTPAPQQVAPQAQPEEIAPAPAEHATTSFDELLKNLPPS
jgi:hypothetical protein